MSKQIRVVVNVDNMENRFKSIRIYLGSSDNFNKFIDINIQDMSREDNVVDFGRKYISEVINFPEENEA